MSESPASQRLSEQTRSARAWGRALFGAAQRFPWLVRPLTRLVGWGAWVLCPGLRENIRFNAGYLFGHDSTPGRRARYGRAVVRRFYRFVLDVASASRRTPQAILDRIVGVDGADHYEAARAHGKGLIVATAHLGSYEVGMAELCRREPKVHVVFQRDVEGGFESLRQQLHERLGVFEAPVDDGWDNWVRLRDALGRDEVVVMQADRVMPGQSGKPAGFFGAPMPLPVGPIKMARLTGAPILPIFAIAQRGSKVRLRIEPPIWVDPPDGATPADPDPLQALARAIEAVVREHPDQWLVLEKAWVEGEAAEA